MFITLREALAHAFARLSKIPRWIMPAVGGGLLGLLSLGVPQALGTGYGWVQGAIEGASWIPSGNAGFWLLWGLAAAKMLATALTISSGGSGGEFGPSLVIGGLVGGGVGILFHLVAPTLVPQPGAFALVGMGAFFGGAAHVPISSLFMVCEMAGSYDLLVPLMLAEGITFVLLRRVTIYPKQVPTRVHSPAHRDEVTVDVLRSISVREVFDPHEQLASVHPEDALRRVMKVISEEQHPGLMVKDKRSQIVGMISLDAVQGSILEDGLEGLAVAADVMTPPQFIDIDDDLHAVLHAFLVTGMNVLPVVEHQIDGRAHVGLITQAHVTRAYDNAVVARMRP
jgi:CIC family chloride channel protein